MVSGVQTQPELRIVEGGLPAGQMDGFGTEPSANPAIVVASGKGGVGKTVVATNLAVALSGFGRRILLVDTNLGLGGSHHLLGLRPERSLAELVGRGDPDRAGLAGGGGLFLAPAGAGESLANLDEVARARLLQSLGRYDDRSDLTVFDTPAGIGRPVTQVTAMAERVVVVSVPERTALADAYALLGAIARRSQRPSVSLVFNNVRSIDDLRFAAQRIAESADRYLKLRVSLLGWIPSDPAIPLSVDRQEPVVRGAPYSPAARALRAIARRLSNDPLLLPPGSGLDDAELPEAS